MKRKLIFLSSIFLMAIVVLAADSPYARRIRPMTDHISTCTENEVGYDMIVHDLYICKNTGWSLSGGGTAAPISATYITQTANATLTNEQALSSLATGILKNTTATGILSIATEADYLPSQTSNSGKFLTTNGTITSWGTVSAGITNSAINGQVAISNGTNIIGDSDLTFSSDTLSITKLISRNDADASQDLIVQNATNGSSAGSTVQVKANSATLTLGAYATGHAAYGAIASGDVYLYTSGNNLALMADSGGIIKFASGGASTKWIMDASGNLITGADNSYDIGATGATRPRTGYFSKSIGGGLFTVATLPTCNAGFEGQMTGVTDALAPTFLATIVGGGAIHAPVYCNGTNWIAH